MLKYRHFPPIEFGISIPMRGIVFYFLHFKLIRPYGSIQTIQLRLSAEKVTFLFFQGGILSILEPKLLYFDQYIDTRHADVPENDIKVAILLGMSYLSGIKDICS